jgi:excisionase family DNA binding protein
MMTVKEAAAALRVSDQTIWRYIKGGELPGRKVGRQYLIPEEAVEARREPERPPPGEGGEALA